MKLRKFIKKVVFALLTAVLAVAVMPYHSSVEAAADDYPDEVYFPIEVLDFRKDNLLFEWGGYAIDDADLELYQDYYGLGMGKGLVEDTLGPDGLPVYKRETVETIARAVQRTMHIPKSGSLNSSPYAGHYLSMRTYIGAPESILTRDTNARISESRMWVPDVPDPDSVQLIPVADESRTYTLADHSSHTYNHVYAEVRYEDYSEDTPIYILTNDAIVFFYNISVSRTFTLSKNTTYRLSSWGRQTDGTRLKIQDDTDDIGHYAAYGSSTEVKTGSDGKITVTIEVNPSSPTAPGGELGDAMASGNYYQTYSVWNIILTPTVWDPVYAGNPFGVPMTVTFPLGDYDESKKKFDDPDLGGLGFGWPDIRTCMDYAYFVTSHFFKYDSTLNEKLDNYENLIFHKVNDDGTISYEFAASNPNKTAAPSPTMKLIYNKVQKTIRNAYGSDTGNPVDGDVTKEGGAFFIADEVSKQWPDLDGNYTYNQQGQWDPNQSHNFHFTVKSSSKFVYKADADQYFYFAGDDDVYVFVNGHLYLDLGGAHSPLDGSINLDDVAEAHPEWGIQSGRVVSLDLFYRERHIPEANFYAKMNFNLESDNVKFNIPYEEIPYGHLTDLEYIYTVRRELVTNSNITFTDNFGNKIGAGGFELEDGISLKYKDDDNRSTGVLEVTVTTNLDDDGNGDIDDTRSKVFEFPGLYAYDSDTGTWKRAREFTSAEIEAVKNYFKGLELVQDEAVTINGPQYDTSYMAYSDYDDKEGEEAAGKEFTFVPKVEYESLQEGAQAPTKMSVVKGKTVGILIGGFKVCTAQEDNEKKKLADYGAFTIDRDLYGESEYARKTPMPYTNNPDILTDTEHDFAQLPRGKYTIKLDDSVLDGYRVFVNDVEMFVESTDTDSHLVRDANNNIIGLTIDFEPEYDGTTWIYPDVQFELKAKRGIPDLKDLTWNYPNLGKGI